MSRAEAARADKYWPRAGLALDPRFRECVSKRVNRPKREIAPKNINNDTCLAFIDDQLIKPADK
jgi:hypothetical protein